MIMQLIGEGRLSLDSAVAQVLPGLRLTPGDAGAEVSIRHLLTHTSGIDGDIFTDTGRGADCVERYAAGLAQATLTYPPGRAYSYCNSGFVLLGRVIEVLDGREWDASLRERLIRPLRLAQTVTLPEEAILHRAAVGHRADPGRPVSVWSLPRCMGPAGGITASARDVLAFARLHLAGGAARGRQLIGQDSVAAMQQRQFGIPVDTARGAAVGLAWRLYPAGDRVIIGHNGGTVGQSAFLRIDPRAQLVACLLTNSPAAEALCQQLFAEIFAEYAGVRIPPGHEPATGVDVDLDRHTGRYERTSVRFDVYVRAGALHLNAAMTGDRAKFSYDGPQEFVLYPADSSGDRFVYRPHGTEPWTPVLFGQLDGLGPYVFTGGRLTLKAP
jgi:CubicO group peptidase (beta-lactamase class C family)